MTFTANTQLRANRSLWWLTYIAVVGGGLMIAVVASLRPFQPYLGLGLAVLALLLAAWIWRPREALAATVALALVSDIVTVWWWPYLKNLSSQESVMFLANSISFSPFEITLVWALAVTAYRNLVTTGRLYRTGPLMLPLLVFLTFLLFGVVNGLASGGDSRAAIFEVRSLLYLPLLYLLVINVCHRQRDFRLLFAAALCAVLAQALLSIHFLFTTIDADARAELESLNEHGSSLGMNMLFVFLIVALLYQGVHAALRVALFVATIPVIWVYFVAERRVAVIGLAAAMLLLAVLLFLRQRRTFWKVIPVLAIVGIGYLGAFWNSDTTAGFPAQAVKGAIAPAELSAADQSSNNYREIEKYNLHVTIRSSPVTGIGFGQPFLRPIPLASISFFEFHEYLPHNSLLWVWIKTGFGGFVTVLYILGRTVMDGAERARRAPPGIDAMVATCSVLFTVMYAVYLYVEIAWEPRNVLLLAVAMALCTGKLDDESEADARTHRTGEPRPQGVIRRHPVGG